MLGLAIIDHHVTLSQTATRICAHDLLSRNLDQEAVSSFVDKQNSGVRHDQEP